MLMDEAGGVKASARDVAQWVQLNLQADPTASPVLQAGIQRAQQRYAQSAQMYQGLGWEMLDYPVTLTALTAVTAPDFVKGHAATLDPASGARASWVHKTGATGGFGAYAAFIPSRQVGIVLLSNKRYPQCAAGGTGLSDLGRIEIIIPRSGRCSPIANRQWGAPVSAIAIVRFPLIPRVFSWQNPRLTPDLPVAITL